MVRGSFAIGYRACYSTVFTYISVLDGEWYRDASQNTMHHGCGTSHLLSWKQKVMDVVLQSGNRKYANMLA